MVPVPVRTVHTLLDCVTLCFVGGGGGAGAHAPFVNGPHA